MARGRVVSERAMAQDTMRIATQGRCLADARMSWKNGQVRELRFAFQNAAYALILRHLNSTGGDQYLAFDVRRLSGVSLPAATAFCAGR